MRNIRIDFNVGPINSSENQIGSFDFTVSDTDNQTEIEKALKKSINRLGIAKNAIIIGFFEVFSGNKKLYDIDVFRAGNIRKVYLNKIQ